MRGGDAQHRRAARKRTAADRPWSARAEPARVPREAAYQPLTESAAFGQSNGETSQPRFVSAGCAWASTSWAKFASPYAW